MSEATKEPEGRPVAYSLKEAAEVLRCAPSQVHYLVRKGQLGSVRRGRDILIPETSIRDFLTPSEPDPELVFYTPQEVADMLKLRNVDTVYKMIRERRIGHVQRGRHYLVSKAALLEYVRKAQVPAVDGDGQPRPLDSGDRKQYGLFERAKFELRSIFRPGQMQVIPLRSFGSLSFSSRARS